MKYPFRYAVRFRLARAAVGPLMGRPRDPLRRLPPARPRRLGSNDTAGRGRGRIRVRSTCRVAIFHAARASSADSGAGARRPTDTAAAMAFADDVETRGWRLMSS